MTNKKCAWCQDHNGKIDLDFSIIDDNFGQYVHRDLIKYCPFCGKRLGVKLPKQAAWVDAVMNTFLGGK